MLQIHNEQIYHLMYEGDLTINRPSSAVIKLNTVVKGPSPTPVAAAIKHEYVLNGWSPVTVMLVLVLVY